MSPVTSGEETPGRGWAACLVGVWLPFVAAAAAAVIAVHLHGASLLQTAGYLAYVGVFLTLPGVLVWRVLWTGGVGSPLEHVVFGTLVGATIQLPVHLLGLVVRVEHLTVLVPVVAVVACAARSDRRELFRPRLEPVNRLVAWTISSVFSYALLWVSRLGWLVTPPWGGVPANPSGDQTFQVGLAAELRHHFPPQSPFIGGHNLHYHWFANEFVAAASTWVDAPLWLLMDRLLLPTFLFLVLGAVAVTAHRCTGQPGVAALAVGVLGLVGDFSPFRWSTVRSSFDERFLAYSDVVSPSVEFSVAFLLLAVSVVLHVVTRERLGARDLVLTGLVVLPLPLAKATALPVLLGGLLAVVLVRVATQQRLSRPLLAVTLWCGVVFLIAQPLVFGNQPTGMELAPFAIGKYAAYHLGLSSTGSGPAAVRPRSVAVFASSGLLLSWLVPAAGFVGFARQRGWRDPGPVLLAGMGASGIGVALAFGNAHVNEDYFVRSATAPLAIGSAWGLWWVLREQWSRTGRLVVAGGLAGGLLTIAASRAAPPSHPVLLPGTAGVLVRQLLCPYEVVAGLLALLTLTGWALTRRDSDRAATSLGLLLAVVVGLGLSRVPGTLIEASRTRSPQPVDAATASLGRGSVEAARWLRGESSADDLVATNAHYLAPGSRDNRHFWISALTERRLLLEGWGYSPEITGQSYTAGSSFYVPYWDQDYLRRHDAVFTDPTPSNLAFMVSRGVRWLFVDDRFPSDVPALRSAAVLAHHDGRYWVFKLPASPQ